MGSAIAAATVGFLMTGAGSSSLPAEAAIAPQERDGAVKFYRIDQIPLTEALTAFADQNDLRLSYDARLTRGVKTHGLSGAFTTQDALRALLDGTALTYRFADNGRSVLITLAQADTGVRSDANGAEALPPIDVGAEANRPRDRGAAGGTGRGDPTAYRIPDATTATKMSAPIMETPASIQVVPQQVLLDQQAASLAKAVENVSGVRTFDATYIGGNDQFQIRGFSTSYVYLDGLRLQAGLPGTSSLANVERVEVLKGPASILYGRADPGGIVNIVTKKPLATPQYSLSQSFGSYDSYRTTLDATGPLTKDDTLLYRVTAEMDHGGSFRETDFSRNYFISPVVRWNIDASTYLSVNLQYNHQVIPFDAGHFAYTKYDPFSLLFGVGPAASLPRERTFNDRFSSSRVDVLKFGYEWSHKFDANWTLTNRFEGLEYEDHTFLVVPVGFAAGSPTALSRVAIENNDARHVITTNLDLTGKFDTFGIEHMALLGADYLSERSFNSFFGASQIRQSSIDYLFPIHSFTPTQTWMYNNFNAGQTSLYRNEWFGVYAQDRLTLPHDFFFLAGVRYDRGHNHNNPFDGNPETLGNSSERVTPRFGLLWRPIPELSLYGSYLENFGQAGGLSGPGGAARILPSESAQQWEVGVKTELFDKRLSATLAFYDLVKKNVAAPDPDPALAAIGYRTALGEVRSRGIELDVAGEILPGWKVIGSYSYIDAAVVKDSGVVSDPLGNIVSANGYQGFVVPDISRHMGNLWTTYELQDGELRGLKLGGGVNGRTKAFGDNLNSFHVPSYAIFSLLASYSWNIAQYRLTAQLNVENLADTRYYPTGNRGQFGVNVGAPRTLKGMIRVEF
ncbi:TonB-dependent siderophore receptor [Methylosinus sp. LW4]|uniref:TonB-dependent siderophore receptor n=1 Tax=Methylosinus sp. LW4 TaxID=136993 RepID=UPI0003A6A6EF|nr:TonB-dependent receptor [Methylosinus sp. LW4]